MESNLMSSHASLSLPGEVLTPGDDGYAEAATTMFATGTPDLVVRPGDAARVAAALRYAADAGLTVSVRSGGHSLAGFSTHTDGMVIDLRRINQVRILDPAARRVRVGAGATWGAVAKTIQPNGFALTAGDTASVGVGGLTLGGGIGWMVRRYGLAIDNLAGAELVTADGQLIRADAAQHQDLFWALRGGGGNFGVVISFDFIAQPVSSVHYGEITYQDADLPRLIAGWRDAMRVSDENLTTTLALMPPVMGQPGRTAATICYASADPDATAAALRPFRRLAPVAGEDIRVVPYAEVLEEAPPMPPGLRFEMRNALLPELDDTAIAAIGALFRGGAMLGLRGLGGAAARVHPDATAFAHRDAEVMVTAGAMVPPGAPPELLGEALAAWPELTAPGTGAGAYIGFLESASADPGGVAAAYPPATGRRLADVKRRYDPGNLFRRNHNIVPTDF
ncbi:MAG TPA: FAD-binding oxidoreductase [Trebonia sp.]